MNQETRDAIAPVLGRTPSGIFILTASDGGDLETGMLSSWVQQCSFDPPMMTVAVNRKRYINDWLAVDTPVILNLVGDSQKSLLGHFGKGFEPDQPAFEGLSTLRGENGITALQDALGYLECRVISRQEAGDHFVYVTEVVGGASGASLSDDAPMVHIRKNGFNY